MVLAAGLGPAGYAFAILHLLTHGFFKAGLFLGSGAVIHAMRKMLDPGFAPSVAPVPAQVDAVAGGSAGPRGSTAQWSSPSP